MMSSPVQESELSSHSIIDDYLQFYHQKYSDYFSTKDQLSCTENIFFEEFYLHAFFHAIQKTITIIETNYDIDFYNVYYIRNNNMTTI